MDISEERVVAGKYRLLSVLGSGGMGVVYRAQQLDIEGLPLRDVAIKIIKPDHSGDATFSRRFIREVRVTARLRGAHTITVFDCGRSEGGQLYYVMELIEGPTLQSLVSETGALSVEMAVSIAAQICDALSEAHALTQPVVHRDLKPANIFLERDGDRVLVKVGDFGIARVLGHDSTLATTGSPGTPRYMPPEQWMGEDVDGRADLYALGIVLYEMLTGVPPFSGREGIPSLMYDHLHNSPPRLPSQVPEGLQALVEQLLAKSPEARPTDAGSVRRQLDLVRTAIRRTAGVVAEASTTVPNTFRDERRIRASLPTWRNSILLRRVGVSVCAVMLALIAAWRWSGTLLPESLRSPHLPRLPAATPLPAASNDHGPASAKDPKHSASAVAPPAGAQPEKPDISVLRAQAERQVAANRLTSPAGDNALETYRKMLALFPQLPDALAGIAGIKEEYLRRAQRAEQQGKWEQARAYFERALITDPTDQAAAAASRALPTMAAPTSRRVNAKGSAFVPGGEFLMGCNRVVDEECGTNEMPASPMQVDAFAIDRTEVTATDYATCVARGACSTDGLSMPYSGGQDNSESAWACNWEKEGRRSHPINCIDWYQAETYCQWAGKRLPTEAEWEKAARGTNGSKYPWGNESVVTAGTVANLADEAARRTFPKWTIIEGFDDGFVTTAPVGTFPAGKSPYGVVDMSGNVWEWTADWYDAAMSGRSVRGGAWDSTPGHARAAYRRWSSPRGRFENVGFRCAAAAEANSAHR